MNVFRIRCCLMAALCCGMMLTFSGCGDEPEDPVPPEPTDEPTVTPDPEPEPEPDPEPDPDPEDSKYYVPQMDEFIGIWECYYDEGLDGTIYTSYPDTFIHWTGMLGFSHDNSGSWMVWNYDALELDKIKNAISEGGDYTGRNTSVHEGRLVNGYYRWRFSPKTEQLTILEAKSTRAWWRVSKFDGDSFELTPYFTDQGHDFRIRKYRRYTKETK